MEFPNVNEGISVPGYTDLKIIGRTTVNPILATLPPLEGLRVGNAWIEFSLTKEYPNEPHEAQMKREPTMAELGIDGFEDYSEMLHLKPSDFASHLPLEDGLQVPLQYIRRLYRLRIINDLTPVLKFAQNDNAAKVSDYINKVIFGDTTYRVIPVSIAGSFANGAPSPRLRVYDESYSLPEIENSYMDNGVEPLLTFYGSRTAFDSPEEILRTFPMIIR